MLGRLFPCGLGLILLLIVSEVTYAQLIEHQPPIAIDRNEVTLLEFNVPGLTQAEVQQGRLFYRYDGDFSYQQREVPFQNGAFQISFRVDDNNASTLEYYFEVTMLSGEQMYYPLSQPQDNPESVEIVSDLKKQKKQLEGVDFTLLSPERDDALAEDDVVIAIALFYDIEAMEPGEFRLFLDQKDVTASSDTSAYYISYIPKNVRGGLHQIRLEYVTENESYSVTSWDFYVVEPGEANFQGFGDRSTPQGNIELSARNQVIAGDINNAYTARSRMSGKYGDFRYNLSAYLTSQESARLQPQNRYQLDLRYKESFELEAGHVYPFLSDFTISGRRINGVNTSVHLLNDKLHMQFLYGALDRGITNQYDSLLVEDVVNSAGDVVDKNYFLSYQDRGRGNFQRVLTGARIGIGNEDRMQFGIHALKVQDDTTSIFNAQNYLDILNSNLSLNSNLNPDEKDSLFANPDLLQIQGGSINPRANLVLGTDFNMRLLDNRIRIESEAVLSALNNNIYGGPITLQRADDLGFDLDRNTEDLLERLSWLIIINENMTTFPVSLSEGENGDLEAAPFFPTSILAGNSEVSYRAPYNNLRLQYRWIGPDFVSLANTTIRRDIAGFTFSDRLNLLSNQIYLTLGYENLNDNVTGKSEATTKTITYRTNASWYPVDRLLPRVNVGIRYRTRDNEISRENYLLPDDLLNNAVQNIRQEIQVINGQDSLVTLVTPTPRNNKTVNLSTSITQQFDFLNARNDASLSFSSLKTTDQVFAFGDVNSNSLSFNLTSRFYDAPYETQFGFTFNNTQAGGGNNEVKIAGLHAGGDLRMMNGKLVMNARVAFTNNQTSSQPLVIRDDPITAELNDEPKDNYYILGEEITTNKFQTYVLQAGARYNIDDNQALLFDANFTNVSGVGRANDRIIQLRYLFSF